MARAHGRADGGKGAGPFAKLLNEFVSQRSYFLLASLNYLMNLFPRRSYFLVAISMGPTSLYAAKLSPKNGPFFGTLKKNCSVRTIKMAVVSHRDLSFSTLSRRKPFTKKPAPRLTEGDQHEIHSAMCLFSGLLFDY